MASLTGVGAGAGSVGRLLASEPLQHPLPVGSAGEVAYYSRTTGVEPFFNDGTLWNPLYSGPPFMRLPETTGLLYALSADDIDGNETFNSAYSDNGAIATWTNRLGATGTSPAAPTGVTATYAVPSLVKPCFRGRDAIGFNGNFTRFDLTSSASGFVTPHQTGVFEMFFGINLQTFGRNVGLFGNLNASNEKGIELDITTSNTIIMLICGGTGGNLVANKTTTAVMPYGELSFISIHGNGSNVYLSINGAAEESGAITSGNFGAGNATRDFMLGCQNASGGATKNMVAQLACFFAWSTELSAVQRKQLFAEFNRVYK